MEEPTRSSRRRSSTKARRDEERSDASKVAAWEDLADGLARAIAANTPPAIVVAKVSNDEQRVARERSLRRAKTVVSEKRVQKRTARRPARWPLAICVFIASTSAGMALVLSPLGDLPAIAHVTSFARTQVAVAAEATLALIGP